MLLISAFLFLFSQTARAEYRAFLLQIKSPDGSIEQVKSNLDPYQYPVYYPLKEGQQVTYTDTWMCRGRTNDQQICPSPRELASDQNPEAAAAATPPTSPSTPASSAPAQSQPPAPKLNSP